MVDYVLLKVFHVHPLLCPAAGEPASSQAVGVDLQASSQECPQVTGGNFILLQNSDMVGFRQ